MDWPTIEAVQPYLTAVGAAVSVATLGLIVNVARLMNDSLKARAEVLEERIKQHVEEVARTEKWSERETTRLNDKIAELQAQIATLLSGAGITTTLEAESATRVSRQDREALDLVLRELRELVATRDTTDDQDQVDPAAALQLARGYLTTGQWVLAAQFFTTYLAANPSDWEAQYARGVAYQNLRGGRESDLSALRSINEAIVFGLEPGTRIDPAMPGRLFIYRGATLKRLGRLDEAEANLEHGRRLAVGDYEKADLAYNLACIYALRGDRQKLLDTLHAAGHLANHLQVFDAITERLDNYFRSFTHDEEFRAAVASLGETAPQTDAVSSPAC